ncbi:MAG: hypothetical protein J6Y39_07095 [Bacteroidaceae bacterium]|nr:hypothetical protein [Bacteroidaceae bacterium]
MAGHQKWFVFGARGWCSLHDREVSRKFGRRGRLDYSFRFVLNWGANERNVTNLSDFVQNEVWKLMGDGDIPMRQDAIRFR